MYENKNFSSSNGGENLDADKWKMLEQEGEMGVGDTEQEQEKVSTGFFERISEMLQNRQREKIEAMKMANVSNRNSDLNLRKEKSDNIEKASEGDVTEYNESRTRQTTSVDEWRQVEERLEEENRKEKEQRTQKFNSLDNPVTNSESFDFFDGYFEEEVEDEDSVEVAHEDNLEDISEKERRMRFELIKLQRRGMFQAGRELGNAEKEKTKQEVLLEEAFRHTGGQRTKDTDTIREKIERAENRIKDVANTRDGFYVTKGFKLRGIARNITNNEMIRTSYVDEKISTVEENMKDGQPTFVYGALGGGKTELVKNAARDASIRKAAMEAAREAKDLLLNEQFQRVRELKEAGDPGYEEAHRKCAQLNRDILVREYEKNYKSFKRGLEDGEEEAVRRFEPLVIAASEDTTSESLYMERTLRVKGTDRESNIKELEKFDEKFDEWSKRIPGWDRLSSKEKGDRRSEFFKVYMEGLSASGTEVEDIPKELYIAVTEGRPVIIDEINAIPAGVLLSMNDILQRRPGEMAYVPGKGAVKIQPGFSITATGNMNTDNTDYAGTKKLNPAFLSRFNAFEYDYLPQSTNGTLETREHPEDDELFLVMMGYLVDRQGNLELPKIDESMRKLYDLARLAKLSQNIFSGKAGDEESHLSSESGVEDTDVELEESVLSMRNILRVLSKWNKGDKMDLDMALWEGFISGIPNEDEKNLMIQLAHDRCDFFAENDGWKVDAKGVGESSTFERDNAERLKDYYRKELEFRSTPWVIDKVFGERPEREEYPEINLDEIESVVSGELSDDRMNKIMNETLPELRTTVKALEVLAEQCGCNNGENTGE